MVALKNVAPSENLAPLPFWEFSHPPPPLSFWNLAPKAIFLSPTSFLAEGGWGCAIYVNLINHQQLVIEKMFLCTKTLQESRYQYIAKEVGLKHFMDPKLFMEYSNDTNNVLTVYKQYWRVLSSKQTKSINSVWYNCWYDCL